MLTRVVTCAILAYIRNRGETRTSCCAPNTAWIDHRAHNVLPLGGARWRVLPSIGSRTPARNMGTSVIFPLHPEYSVFFLLTH